MFMRLIRYVKEIRPDKDAYKHIKDLNDVLRLPIYEQIAKGVIVKAMYLEKVIILQTTDNGGESCLFGTRIL